MSLDTGLVPIFPPMRDVAAALRVPMPAAVRHASERDAVVLYDGEGPDGRTGEVGVDLPGARPVGGMKLYLKAAADEAERQRLAGPRRSSLEGVIGAPAHETPWALYDKNFNHAKAVRGGLLRGPW